MSMNVPSGYKQTKVGVIPEDWECLPASNYFSKRIAKGYKGLEIYSVTIRKSWQKRSELDRDIGSDVDVTKSLLAEKGDLVYNTMRMWQGALGMAENSGVVSPAYIVLRPKSMINSKFAFYMLKSYTYLHYLTSYSYGLTSDRLRLYFKDFGMIPFICPPLKEQEKIVQILAVWDDAISKQETLIKAKEELKKGLMQKLLSGEVRFDGFDEEWKIKKIEDLPIIISDGNYGELYPKSEDFKEEGIAFFRANNIKNLKIDDKDTKYISEVQHKLLTSGHLKTNDILITTRGELGNIALVDKQFEGMNINAQLCLLRIKNDAIVYYAYLLYFLDSHSCKKQYKMLETGSALKQLPKGNLKKIKIKLPSLQEQQRIAQVLSFADKEIVLLKKKLETLKEQKHGLMQRLLSGEVRVKV